MRVQYLIVCYLYKVTTGCKKILKEKHFTRALRLLSRNFLPEIKLRHFFNVNCVRVQFFLPSYTTLLQNVQFLYNF